MPRLDGGAVVQALQLTSSAVDLPPSAHMDTTLEIIIKCIKIQTMPEGNHFCYRIPSLQSIKTESHTCNLKDDHLLGVQARSHRENFDFEFLARIFLGFCIDILSLECVRIPGLLPRKWFMLEIWGGAIFNNILLGEFTNDHSLWNYHGIFWVPFEPSRVSNYGI